MNEDSNPKNLWNPYDEFGKNLRVAGLRLEALEERILSIRSRRRIKRLDTVANAQNPWHRWHRVGHAPDGRSVKASGP